MPIKVTVTLDEDADDLLVGYGAGAIVYIERDTTSAFSSPTVLSSTPTVTAATQQYEHWDDSGATTSWYRWRVGDSGATKYTEYSDPVQGAEFVAYATINDLVQTMELPGETRYALLWDLLIDVSAFIDRHCHRSFHKYPRVSGTDTFYVDVKRESPSLARASMGGGFTNGLPLDIVSVTSVGIRDDENDSTYTTIAADDTGYYLQPGDGVGLAGTDWPYEDIVLSANGADYTLFPPGRRAVEIVATVGFPAIPPAVRRATVDMARESYRQAPGGGGPAQVGVNMFNVPVLMTGWPDSFRDLVRAGSPYRKKGFAAN